MDETKHCDVCGRELRTPASRARGRGPKCDAKVRPPETAPAALPGIALETRSEAFIPRRGDRARARRMAEQAVRNWSGTGQTGPDLLDGQAADPDQDGAS